MMKMVKKRKQQVRDPDLEKIPSGSNWQRVLIEVYRKAPHMYGESQKNSYNADDHPLAAKLGIKGYELMLAVAFLTDNKLVERTQATPPFLDEWRSQLVLTERGFRVCSDLIKNKADVKLQAGLLVFTAMITFTGMAQIIHPETLEGKVATILLFLLVGAIGIWQLNTI